MTDKHRVAPANMDFVWHSDYYDGPINGIARHKGRLHWFERDFDTSDFVLTPLVGMTKLKTVLRWRWFEVCVGKHCSYPEGKVFTSRKGQWFWRELANLYYRKRVFKAPKKKESHS